MKFAQIFIEIFLQNCDNNTNGGIMDNRKLNRRNFLLLLFVVAACIMGGRSIFAVSYTHLDVYKRQDKRNNI